MLNKDKKFYIETFGCQMNEFDSERILFLLQGIGYIKADNIYEADLIVFNTCSVREKAERRLYGHIGNLKFLKNNKPGLIICVGGCTAQNLKEKILQDFPYVDIVFGTHNIENLPELLKKRAGSGHGICEAPDISQKYHENSAIKDLHEDTSLVKKTGNTSFFSDDFYNFSRKYHFKAFLPVSVGCNNFCSYCIVPYVRGMERSLKPDTIINKVKNLVDDGVVEITLLGQNVNSYGQDFDKDDLENNYGNHSQKNKSFTFAVLLNEVANIRGLKRIRFMTSHPKDFNEDLISVIRDNKNIMNHIHLPLQAGSDKILGLMNRKYTIGKYIELYKKIKKEITDCAITTDIIVGFPGEEEEDFKQTLGIVKSLRFNRAFTFIYSNRKGTKAGSFEDNIPVSEKMRWFNELVRAQAEISYEENLKLSGKKAEVLVEGPGSKGKGMLKGRMENNNIVNFTGNTDLIGKFADVRITGIKSFYLVGETADINK